MPTPEHSQAQELASRAALFMSRGDRRGARTLFSHAADLEVAALNSTPRTKPRTWGILAVSASALLYKARRYADAEALLHSLLQHRDMAPDVRYALRDLLDTVWDEQTLPAGYEYSPKEILVSLRGGAVGRGTAPLEIVLSKGGEIRSLVTRTVEWTAKLPFRKRGGPPPNVLGALQARITQPQAGSYRFAIRLVAPEQIPLFPDLERVGVTGVVESLFYVVEAATSGRPDAADRVRELVPDAEYRGAMLKLLRNIVPSGDQIGEVELAQVTKVDNELPEIRAVRLSPGVATSIREVLRADAPASTVQKTRRVEISGVLRAVHLEDDWLEVLSNDQLIHVDGAGEMLDDVIGPMVNKKVTIHAENRAKPGRGPKLFVVDVEPAEE